MGAIAVVLLIVILALTGWRWGADSRAQDDRDAFFWPNG
jgi:hypothetical protein